VGHLQPDYGLPQLGHRHQPHLRSGQWPRYGELLPAPIYGFQAVSRHAVSYLATLNNFVGNVVGSSQMQSLVAYGTSTMGQVASVEYPANPKL